MTSLDDCESFLGPTFLGRKPVRQYAASLVLKRKRNLPAIYVAPRTGATHGPRIAEGQNK